MKKTLIALTLAALSLSAQTTTNAVDNGALNDMVALQNAKIAALDANFAVYQAQYNLQKNNLLRQQAKLQSSLTNTLPTIAPAVTPQPSSSTPK